MSDAQTLLDIAIADRDEAWRRADTLHRALLQMVRYDASIDHSLAGDEARDEHRRTRAHIDELDRQVCEAREIVKFKNEQIANLEHRLTSRWRR